LRFFSATQVAFDGHVLLWVNGDRSERAGFNTGAAAYAKFLINENEIIDFANRPHWTDISARGFSALHADDWVIGDGFFFDDPNAASPYSKFFIMGVHTSSNTCHATGTTFACIRDLRHFCTYFQP